YKTDRQKEKEKMRERNDLWNKIENMAKQNPKYRDYAQINAKLQGGFISQMNKNQADMDDLDD
ncbi:unnamed protein product, partial [Brachionus calyciflorus]